MVCWSRMRGYGDRPRTGHMDARGDSKTVSFSTPAHLDWVSFEQAKVGLLIWEAFVSGDSKGSGHINDAVRAVEAFKAKLPVPETDIQATNPMSLAGFALVLAGWPVAVEALKTPCLVVKARTTTLIETSEP